jgi:Carboxypeptidase regulatory-like domain/TonB-dependent Receptor Plug Domain
MNSFSKSKRLMLPLLVLLIAGLVAPAVFAQETTGGLQGTVKDPSGAVVSGATVGVTSSALIGTKSATTDAGGYFRFANLPPGSYTITVTAPNFRSSKQENIMVGTGRLPSIDVTLQVGTASETVEVTGTAPIVDVTQSKVQTIVTEDVLVNVPKGRSFQSVIQFAPGARSEPLQGGYQIDGASNSENSYLVEGQETANVITGQTDTNVPMEFIQEVQIKSSGFEAEYGGALGGVVNVVQKRGSNQWHGSVFTYYQGDAFDAAPDRTLRKNPDIGTNVGGLRLDQPYQYYQPMKDHYRIWEPGVEVGGYLLKDRLWVFASTIPRLYRLSRTVGFTNVNPGGPIATAGSRTFPYAVDTYYSLARVDFLATQKIRLFGSWNYAYRKGTGTSLPAAMDVFGARDLSSGNSPDQYNSGIGYVAPNVIYNTGADITITPNLVATARFGYFYQDYQERGKTTGVRYYYRDTSYPYSTTQGPAPATLKDITGTQTLGVANPAAVHTSGFTSLGDNSNQFYDKNSRTSFSGDLAYFKKGFGTHNLKGGYSFNRLYDNILTGWNTAVVYVGFGRAYSTFSTSNNCAAIRTQNIATYGVAGTADDSSCIGKWGTVNIREYNTEGIASSFNHALYLQDAWTVGHGVTLNLGIRFDKETVPAFTAGLPPGIQFGFADKVAPRLGASWDVLQNGKFKVYGSFGYFFDIMKFNMPRGSFGGDYWHDCAYTMDTPDPYAFQPTRTGAGNHYCPSSGGANGIIPGRLIENADYRAQSGGGNEGVIDPNIKPMKQHEMVAGADWAITPLLAFETRYSRKRLDTTIEDAGFITSIGEQYSIVNPGFGIDKQTCTGCPPNPKAVRNYDGLEFRLTKRSSGRWFGSLSYTYSRLYGNYSGLTATDVSDGGAGRQGANVDRAFDEPFMSFDANGKAINGPLATDRPHTFKAFGYYRLKWWKFETMLGAYQQWYSGTPLSSYISVYAAPVFVANRGGFVNLTRDATTGAWTASAAKSSRTPSFSDTDFSLIQEMHVSKANEKLVLGFEANITNLFNQHSVTYIDQNMINTGSIKPPTGAAAPNYLALETGYNYINTANTAGSILSSTYGLPYGWQDPRSMRFKIRFSF